MRRTTARSESPPTTGNSWWSVVKILFYVEVKIISFFKIQFIWICINMHRTGSPAGPDPLPDGALSHPDLWLRHACPGWDRYLAEFYILYIWTNLLQTVLLSQAISGTGGRGCGSGSAFNLKLGQHLIAFATHSKLFIRYFFHQI